MADSEKLTYSIPEVARVLGISRNLAYELAKRNALPCIKLGEKRLLIPRKGLEDFLNGGMRLKA